MADTVEQQQQNAVVRLINLPFVSSTYDLVSSTYVVIKDNHPYLKSVCDVTEKSVKSMSSVAITMVMPVLQKLEPQVALVNNIACFGLNKIEEKLPILHQPSEKVVANASEAVVGARDAVIHSITGVVDKTKGAVQDRVGKTKAAVKDSFTVVLESSVLKSMGKHVDSALMTADALLDQYLRKTDAELAMEATKPQGFEVSQNEPSYYVCLESLSSKAQKRVYQQALTGIKDAKCRCQEAISQLQNIVDLIEYGRKNMSNASQKIHDAQEKVYNKWVEWTKGTGEDAGGATEGAEQNESRMLTIAQNLTRHLQTTCLTLVSSIRGLPQDIQTKADSVSALAVDVYQNFHSASSFREMSDSLLTASKDKFTKIKASMDGVVDYILKDTDLTWLAGALKMKPAGSQHQEKD